MPPEEVEESPKWEPVIISQPDIKKPKMSDLSNLGSESSVISSQTTELSWNSLDLAKAADLLGPNVKDVTFKDEDEMRRVFALLYDAFRCMYYHSMIDLKINLQKFHFLNSFSISSPIICQCLKQNFFRFK